MSHGQLLPDDSRYVDKATGCIRVRLNKRFQNYTAGRLRLASTSQEARIIPAPLLCEASRRSTAIHAGHETVHKTRTRSM